MGLFIVGFISSEALLFLQGIFYWVGAGTIANYHELLFGVSIFLPLGLVLFFIAQMRNSKTINKLVIQETEFLLKEL